MHARTPTLETLDRLYVFLSQQVKQFCSESLFIDSRTDFKLSLETTDDISGEVSLYQGPITFTILGAGLTPSSIMPFNNQQILDYNSGSKSLWTYSNADSSDTLTTNSSIRLSYIDVGHLFITYI